ncbi:phospholipase D family protein [Bizionia arctica]|uniref:PLD phosphodiesterase domain-containing protein n=1 Tax=Bizionia arctica TaxID=1495645 RepID=A0A917GMU6_9FLAO|nr:phospholipase D family protein [Bizionia arctica]GGG51703.1 hypothetical protein GCM10010976_23590 [Bizionia arctica]
MLDAKNNRLDYGAALKPPMGYDLDFAVTTTYTLDLEAILLIPVALFFSGDLDFNPKEIREDMLEALTNVSKHIAVFCQRGKIKVPKPYNPLMAYWEKGIHQIQMPNYDQSFHPKIWIIRYTAKNKKEPIKYRFISTSRNLTFSRDWDMAITTDGEVNKIEKENNKGIIDLLQYLKKTSGFNIPEVFFKELPKVAFEVPDGFTNIDFHPIGINKTYKNPITTKSEKQDYRLVVSPFLDKTTLNYFTGSTKQCAVFSTDFELSSLKEADLKSVTKKFCFSPFIEEAESMDELSEPDEIPMSQSLHAKLFIDKKGSSISWYLGSANATKPASEKNIEFMVELKTDSSSKGPQQMVRKLTTTSDSPICLFEPFDSEERTILESEKIKEQQIRKIIHTLSDIIITGKAIKNESGNYDLEITVPKKDLKLPEGIIIKIKPLPEKRKSSVAINAIEEQIITDFNNYEEINLSPFLIIEIELNSKIEKRFVVDMKINLEETRFNKIFSTIINNRSRFLNYLSFLLSEETPDKLEDEYIANKKRKGTGMDTSIAFFDGTPIYEKLMITSSRNPERLKKIDRLIERLKGEKETNGTEIVTIEFEELWQVFKPTNTIENGS